MLDATAHDPPRSTRYSPAVTPSKKGAEYVSYTIGVKPGHGRSGDVVHSQTSPSICSTPYADAPPG
jgi:hypothetical protein